MKKHLISAISFLHLKFLAKKWARDGGVSAQYVLVLISGVFALLLLCSLIHLLGE